MSIREERRKTRLTWLLISYFEKKEKKLVLSRIQSSSSSSYRQKDLRFKSECVAEANKPQFSPKGWMDGWIDQAR